MGLFNFIAKQFLDIIQWEDTTQDTLVHKFPLQDNEIQNGSKLIVRPGQSAVFVNEGQIADVFIEGTHQLTTKNLPVLGDLKGWAFGFNSPFKADVYFVNTRQFLDQKWGTPHPVLVADPKFEQVQLRAFGSFGFQVTDPRVVVATVSSSSQNYEVETLKDQLKDYIIAHLAPVLAQQNVTVAELAANYNIINEALQAAVKSSVAHLGVDLTILTISNISLPDEIQAMLNERTLINMMGGMDNYTRVKQLEVMETAAGNPSGGAGMMQAGIGMGVGMAMGQTLAHTMGGIGNQVPESRRPIPIEPSPPAPDEGRVCGNCGFLLAGESMFCSSCGSKMATSKPAPATPHLCSECGDKLDPGLVFCRRCGHRNEI